MPSAFAAGTLCLAVSAGREIGLNRIPRHGAGTRNQFDLANYMKAHERENAIASLKETLRSGMTIYTVLRSVSASGVSRTFDLYYVENDKIIRITWSAAKALEWSYCRTKEALRVSGCGMDMGWHTVYSLSQVVLGYGYALTHRWL